jgi:hypothetical protein
VAQLDASVFSKRIGDEVREGEMLGHMDNQPVLSPIDGIVESVAFDPGMHTFTVVLARKSPPGADPGSD